MNSHKLLNESDEKNLNDLHKEDKEKQKHKEYLSIRKHVHSITLLSIWVFFILFIVCVLHFIIPNFNLLNQEKLSLLIDTIIKLMIGMIIGKITNVLTKED